MTRVLKKKQQVHAPVKNITAEGGKSKSHVVKIVEQGPQEMVSVSTNVANTIANACHQTPPPAEENTIGQTDSNGNLNIAANMAESAQVYVDGTQESMARKVAADKLVDTPRVAVDGGMDEWCALDVNVASCSVPAVKKTFQDEWRDFVGFYKKASSASEDNSRRSSVKSSQPPKSTLSMNFTEFFPPKQNSQTFTEFDYVPAVQQKSDDIVQQERRSSSNTKMPSFFHFSVTPYFPSAYVYVSREVDDVASWHWICDGWEAIWIFCSGAMRNNIVERYNSSNLIHSTLINF